MTTTRTSGGSRRLLTRATVPECTWVTLLPRSSLQPNALGQPPNFPRALCTSVENSIRNRTILCMPTGEDVAELQDKRRAGASGPLLPPDRSGVADPTGDAVGDPSGPPVIMAPDQRCPAWAETDPQSSFFSGLA